MIHQTLLLKDLGDATLENFDKLRNSNGKTTVGALRLKLQKVMQKYAGVFRTQELLEEGCTQVSELYCELDDLKVRHFVFIVISGKSDH